MVNCKTLFGGIYKDKTVLVTGDTGFKGSWLSLWLNLTGAKVFGYALAPSIDPSHYKISGLDINHMEGDIRDSEKLAAYVNRVKPEIVFHLAAQALVRDSYANPVETYSTNVIGTLQVLEACRKSGSVRAIVNVTSDKCYENHEWNWGYRENDQMGGFDPYSSSKGCAELLTSSYRNSFFNIHDYNKKHNILLASVRAGNVIGGGDWAKDRLIPDMVKAASENKAVTIRNPNATRPWQQVLEPLSGYLTLGWRLLEEKKEYAEGWNFGPELSCNVSVNEIVSTSGRYWNAVKTKYDADENARHEANLLMLDCSKAHKLLKWKPVWTLDETIEKTINWYKEFYLNGNVNSVKDIEDYITKAKKLQVIWAC